MPRFTDIFIQRPVLAMVISLLILLLGGQALTNLQVRQFPLLENTTITVTTAYPGASPDVVQAFITTPMQQAVASAEGIDFITATSQQGVSVITLQLRLDANADRASSDIIAKTSEVRALLPREAFDPVVVRQAGEGRALAYISFSSKRLTPPQITDYIQRVAQPAIQAAPGVAQVKILGAQNFAMRVWLNPDRMAAHGVTATDVKAALQANNFAAAPGEMKGDYVRANVDAKTDLSSVTEFNDLVVASRSGGLVRLRDVADLDLGPQSTDSASYAGGVQAIFVSVDIAPGANPLTVMPAVYKAIDQLNATMPPDLTVAVPYDGTKYISSAIDEVITTVLEAALIVIVVVWLFIGDWRATLVPIVTIPLSLIGVMFLMNLLGYSLNLLTLLAMVLAIGLVVDDAIVVVENIARHIEEGLTPQQAALKGAREIALPVIGMTVTLAAVYAPIGFVGGLTGILFQEFAFTLAAAVAISGVVALTLSPMMCRWILRPSSDSPNRFSHWIDGRFDSLRHRYARGVQKALASRGWVLALGALVFASVLMLYDTTRKELAPEEDQGFMFMVTDAPEWTNLDFLNANTEKLQGLFSRYSEYQNSFIINMAGGSQGFGGFMLKPWGAPGRDRTPMELQQDIQGQLNTVPGIKAQLFNVPALPSPGGGAPIQFVVQTLRDYRSLAGVMEEVENKAKASGLFIFTAVTLSFDKPQVDITINRTKANELGVTMADIGDTLSTLMGGNYVNLFQLEGRSYQVIPQAPRQFRLNEDMIGRYYVRATSGDLVPLSTFVTLTRSVQPNALTSFQQLNSATLQAAPFPGRTIGETMTFLEKTAKEVLPEGYLYDYAGETRQLKQEGGAVTAVFALAMLVIFLVLAAQYESFRDPIIILITVPLSLAGALFVLNIGGLLPPPLSGGFSINIYSQIGLLTLAGIVSKHGILMVSFANEQQRDHGLSKRDAIIEAASVRLRPILMTTAAMVAGVVPLMSASGAGAVSRFSMGVTLAAGMLIGTLFTLFVLPVVYTLLAGDHRPTTDIAQTTPVEDPS